MKKTLYLAGLLLLIFILWDFAILYPLKLLVVFFHESSHALATVFTGGSVGEMVVAIEQGGHVMSRGGSRFIILNAGYLGSLFWGALIYMMSVASRLDKKIMAGLGVVVGLITLVFVSNLFAIVFGLGVALAMMLAGKYLSEAVNDFLLRLIGLTSMVYVPFDIFSDTISRSYLNSDARMLAEEFGGFTMLWGGIWIIISLLIIFACLRWSLSKGGEESPATQP